MSNMNDILEISKQKNKNVMKNMCLRMYFDEIYKNKMDYNVIFPKDLKSSKFSPHYKKNFVNSEKKFAIFLCGENKSLNNSFYEFGITHLNVNEINKILESVQNKKLEVIYYIKYFTLSESCFLLFYISKNKRGIEKKHTAFLVVLEKISKFLSLSYEITTISTVKK